MKTSLSLYLTLATLQVCKICAILAKNDYICGANIITHNNIENSVKKACETLYRTKGRLRFPAEYDASTTYFISDARLFSWPIMLDGKSFSKGRPGIFRAIMDSSCHFFGIIMKYHHSPDRRCFQPVEPPREIDDSSNSASRNLPILRGYNCKDRIFDHFDVDRIRENSMGKIRTWKSHGKITGLMKLEVVDKLFETPVFLLPSKLVVFPNHVKETTNDLYLIVINSQEETLGMVYKSEDNWGKCDGLWEMEPERRRPLVSGKNSIGETIFQGLSDYQCGPHKFTRESVNSHMQIACKIFEYSRESKYYIRRSRLSAASIRTDTGRLVAWRFPLQLRESEKITRHDSIKNKCVIVLDKHCNFYGAYQYDSNMKVACNQLSPQNLPGTSDYEVSTSEFSWLDEFFEGDSVFQ